ncbi:single-stranded-DNA-specific exonuclease RecJ [Polluticoccus soli]|uniref:single-stranded-DNA-specific exonuclease RecJ n=1 Tax=Polluticoccus soli TaxID=3034150 RepID=UPI0023E0E65A|nr:single-stranded-DNA-specific exonuclease RecJ [Flavipsychrobacter sp. JY13-12]
MAQTKRWTLKPADEAYIKQLSDSLHIHPALCRILAVRGIAGFDSAKSFFRPELSHLHDPFLMKGMETAVTRISEAMEWHERIMIYGDYDVDGTTAVAVVYSFLRKNYKGELSYYIPHRYREGYGVSKAGIDHAHANGYTLLITLDCGIKSVELIQYAQSLGIDVIVCDHHTPDAMLPPAKAILNPKQSDCKYPYKELSGAGIGFKLITALCLKWGKPLEDAYEYLDLVATSIAADIVPIDGENRVLAFYGLKRVNENPSPGIRTLKALAQVNRNLSISDLVFVIGPRVNAAGRMDDARKAVDLFIETDTEKLTALAEALQSDNFDRKEVDKNITEEALAIIQGDTAMAARKSTVLYQSHWHKGVVGIVASRLIDHYYRPTIILTLSNDKVTGSARSVSGFNIYEAVHECRDLLDNYGGHFYAAGMTLHPDRVAAFVDRFEQVVAGKITEAMLIPEIEIDAEISLRDVRPAFHKIIKQFEPFGPANMKPIFLTKRVYDYQGHSRIVKDLHIKFVVHQQSGVVMDGIGFNLADKFDIVQKGPFDILYNIDENEFNGITKLQIRVVDIRPAQ